MSVMISKLLGESDGNPAGALVVTLTTRRASSIPLSRERPSPGFESYFCGSVHLYCTDSEREEFERETLHNLASDGLSPKEFSTFCQWLATNFTLKVGQVYVS